MREIKFRAWDKVDKTMRSWKDIELQKSSGEREYFVGYKANKAITKFDHEQVLMEYTGLKDKNGTEIYEGDVISYNKSREVVYFDTSLRIPCFTTGIGLGSSTKRHPYVITKRHEVIGNIYENPELLK